MRISDWSSDVCSSDLIVGHVRAVGDEVTDFAVGETVGVGCMVDSCQACPSCEEGLEQYCTGSGFVGTYNAPTPDAPGHTLGGYSQALVVSDKFVLKIRHPEAQLAAVDRQRVVSGKRVTGRLDLGGRRIIKKKNIN